MRNDELLSLFTPQTRRDKQIRVGASNLSNPCALCLAEDILPGIKDKSGVKLRPREMRESNFVMGARIGTDIHRGLEYWAKRLFPKWELEQRFELGLYENYGLIRSTADAYDPEDGTIVDYKTTTRSKLKALSAVFAMHGDVPDVTGDSAKAKYIAYVAQTHLYALGKERRDGEGTVRKIKVVFIPRDASQVSDVEIFTLDYDHEKAEQVWQRGQHIIDVLCDGFTDFPSYPGCYRCNVLAVKKTT